MLTASAARFAAHGLESFDGVATRRELAALGIGAKAIAGQVAAGRWRVLGSAVVLHNAPLTREQHVRVAVITCGPRAVATSFTAAAAWGLRGWERDEVHVLAPAGTRRPSIPGLVLHRRERWVISETAPARRLHLLEPALVLAAGGLRSPRHACGLLAAAVQQRLVGVGTLHAAVTGASRTRHRAVLLQALDDIGQGAQALSEIDFVALCRRAGLPEPSRQAVRVEPNGRRRYLDVEWRRGSRVVAAEVDGAVHLRVNRWIDDQIRQNEVVIGGTVVLRFPSVLVRTEPALVADQLRRALT